MFRPASALTSRKLTGEAESVDDRMAASCPDCTAGAETVGGVASAAKTGGESEAIKNANIRMTHSLTLDSSITAQF